MWDIYINSYIESVCLKSVIGNLWHKVYISWLIIFHCVVCQRIDLLFICISAVLDILCLHRKQRFVMMSKKLNILQLQVFMCSWHIYILIFMILWYHYEFACHANVLISLSVHYPPPPPRGEIQDQKYFCRSATLTCSP